MAKNKIITSEGNVQFQTVDGIIINVHPFHVYSLFNVDTVSFLLIAMPKSSGLAIFTSKAEDLEVNGVTYTFEQLPNALSEAFAIAGAQARAEIVEELPETGMTNTIYLVPKPDGQSGFDEYIYLKDEQRWELIGDTSIEFSQYVQKTDFNTYSAETETKINYISGAVDTISGDVDTISGDVISLFTNKADSSALTAVNDVLTAHTTDTSIHFTTGDVQSQIDSSISGKTDESAFTAHTSDTTVHFTTGDVQTMIDDSISGKTNESDFSAHTANTNIHVTTAQTAAWNAKSDFSGSYNDLTDKPTIPTVPTSNTAFTNDAGYITVDALSGYAESSAVTEEITAAVSGLQETLSAGTNIDITDNVISVTGISIETSSAITSGDTNPVEGGVLYDELRIPGEVESGLTLEWELYDGGSTINYPSGQCSKIIFENIAATGETEGDTWFESTNGFIFTDSEGSDIGLIALDVDNNGVITITNATNVTYSIDGNNLTVEYPSIAANVDYIYANYDNYWTTTAFVNVSAGMIPLINQVSANTAAISGKADTSAVTAVNDALTGHTADTSIHFTTGDVQSMITAATSGKADTSAVTAVQDSLSGYVTTDTAQEITGEKTFVGNKKLTFKQSAAANKLGFTLYNSASTNNELASFEFRPDTYTDSSSVKHPLLYLGHYRKTETANAGVPQTMVGFRQYDQSGAAAYHYLMPLPVEAKTPFSLTTSFKNYFAPLGFKNGDTMIKTDNTGVADFSDVLGGLKLVKLTQTEYDNLGTKDSQTLYIVTDS